jgi:hypothetical protein
LQVVGSAGGLSAHEAAHDAERPVAVHFGGRSLAVSVTVDSFAQQMGAEAGQSEAVAHESVVFGEQELTVLHAFI